ncbi:hypothetical protein LG634_21200 [Streptomyces bambusae]|nr:hypothetical protein [Streptomyces bambusae]MCB5167347.1 hypothetical protein [Streptomyces bambusae]
MADPTRDVARAFPTRVHETARELLKVLEDTGNDPSEPALWAGLVVVVGR